MSCVIVTCECPTGRTSALDTVRRRLVAMHDLAAAERREGYEAGCQPSHDQHEASQASIPGLGQCEPGEDPARTERDRRPRGPRAVVLHQSRLHERARCHLIRGRDTRDVRRHGRHGCQEERNETVAFQLLAAGHPTGETDGHAYDRKDDRERMRDEVQEFPVQRTSSGLRVRVLGSHKIRRPPGVAASDGGGLTDGTELLELPTPAPFV